ncbi:MAG TPA: group 1 truncated hemoglobin [Acidimicrobiales bacterium]|jgi:hemoglobin|nr:group 1 truncated hemoglobin [Acidimicrobiales bacterium]
MSIYDEIGGRAAVDAAVAGFYQRVLNDESLFRYFDGINLAGLMRHQRAFIGMALGGPVAYQGRDMKAAHAGLDITPEAFGAVVQHLIDTLAGLGVPEDTIATIVGALAPLQDDIVTAPSQEMAS